MARRLAVLVAIVACVALAAPGLALAVAPERVATHYTGTNVVTDLCPFPVTVDFDQVGTEIDRNDAAGNWMSMEATVTEQDTYSAAHTLVTAPYTFHVAIRFDADGNLVQYGYAGVSLMFKLPDGTRFVMAGLATFPSYDSWLVLPDHGRMGNVDALCSALGG